VERLKAETPEIKCCFSNNILLKTTFYWFKKKSIKNSMSRRYFFKRASDLSTDNLTDILIEIDNGTFDDKLDEKGWYNKMNLFREEVIEILLRRYRSHYSFTSKKDESLDKVYNLYLKHYL